MCSCKIAICLLDGGLDGDCKNLNFEYWLDFAGDGHIRSELETLLRIADSDMEVKLKASIP